MKKWKSIAATAATALTVNANAAVEMFLKIENPEINGESQDAEFNKSIDVLAWSWGLSNSGTQHTGTGSGGGQATIQDLSVTKFIDKATVDLYKNLVIGDTLGKVTLKVRRPGKTPLVYLEIVMEDVLVSSASTGASGGEDKLTENVTFNFAKVTTKYTPQNADGSVDAEITYCYDIQASAEC